MAKYYLQPLLLIVFFILAKTGYSDQDCPFIRLDKYIGSMADMPTVDQSDLDNCYAAAAAQALDAYRFTHGDVDRSKRISSLNVGLSVGDGLRGVGSEKDVLSFVQEHSTVCSESAVRRIIGNRSPLQFLNQIDSDLKTSAQELELKNTLLSWYGPGYQSKLNDQFKKALVQNYGTLELGDRWMQDRLSCDLSQQNSPSEALKELEKSILSVSYVDSRQRILHINDLLLSACGNDVIHLHPPAKMGEQDIDIRSPLKNRVKSVAPSISKLLNEKNAQPVMLSYCDNFLKGDPDFSLTQDSLGACVAHESLIIGQRSFHGKCQLLLRNSWGAQWCPAKSSFTSDCKNGQVWIDREKLSQQTFELTTFSQTQTVIPPANFSATPTLELEMESN